MFFQKTTTYALRLLIYMAADAATEHNATTLHEKLGIPLRYLRRILTDLSKSGFIISSRGRNGGFVFSRSPAKIYLSEIIDSVEGFESYKSCVLGMENCTLQPVCAMHELWEEARDKMNRLLMQTSLEDLRVRNPFGL